MSHLPFHFSILPISHKLSDFSFGNWMEKKIKRGMGISISITQQERTTSFNVPGYKYVCTKMRGLH